MIRAEWCGNNKVARMLKQSRMMKRSTRLVMAGLYRSLYPLRKDALINACCTALSITLAVLIAKLLHFPAPYWAGISAMVITMPTFNGITNKGMHRLFGTYFGAIFGFIVIQTGVWASPWLFTCLLFTSIVLPLAWMRSSRYPYAWLIGGITAHMVMLAGFIDPRHSFIYAQTRALEITLGAGIALAVYGALTLLGKKNHQLEVREKKKRPLDALAGNRARTALAGGFAACIAAWIWISLGLDVGIEQSVTTVWVLSFSGNIFDTYHKAAQRFVGCMIGGVLAGLLLMLSGNLVVVSVLLFLCCLLGCVIQNGPTHARYFGMQAVFAFLMIYADRPNDELIALRMVSIVTGLALVFACSWLITRADEQLVKLKWTAE